MRQPFKPGHNFDWEESSETREKSEDEYIERSDPVEGLSNTTYLKFSNSDLVHRWVPYNALDPKFITPICICWLATNKFIERMKTEYQTDIKKARGVFLK